MGGAIITNQNQHLPEKCPEGFLTICGQKFLQPKGHLCERCKTKIGEGKISICQKNARKDFWPFVDRNSSRQRGIFLTDAEL